MDYKNIVNTVKKLDIIPNEKIADYLVKATLGLIAGSMEEPISKEFIKMLPAPLNYDLLMINGYEKADYDTLVMEITKRFNLSNEDGKRLVQEIYNSAKSNMKKDLITIIEKNVPDDILSMIENRQGYYP